MLRARGKSGTIYFKRRVPKEFAGVHGSPFVEVSLKTDSLAEAREKASAIWAEYLRGWQDRIDGRSADAERRFEAVRRIARAAGFQYRVMSDLAAMPLGDILDRIEAVPAVSPGGVGGGAVDPDIAAALVGAVEPPRLTVTRALEKYWELSASKLIGKSDDQRRRWRNPKIKAVRNFVAVCGDLAIEDIRADEMQDFQDWWIERIEVDGLTANSANKDFSHLSTVISTVCKKMRLGIDPPVRGWSIGEGRAKVRPPFSTAWIRDRIVPHLIGVDCTLNDQARDIVLIMVNTGARPSEIAGLRPCDIVIDGAAGVPYIDISGDARALKTATSERRIPLVGVSLDAALRVAETGFPRYADAASLSALVNKYFLNNGLKETADHVLYSLRHSFEDRLLAAGVDERIRRDLMGHSLGGRQRYGAGLALGPLRDILAQVAV